MSRPVSQLSQTKSMNQTSVEKPKSKVLKTGTSNMSSISPVKKSTKKVLKKSPLKMSLDARDPENSPLREHGNIIMIEGED